MTPRDGAEPARELDGKFLPHLPPHLGGEPHAQERFAGRACMAPAAALGSALKQETQPARTYGRLAADEERPAQHPPAEMLRNVLQGVGVAVLLLDAQLNIRLFTPEIKPFFHLIAGDIGRPLEDLHYAGADEDFSADCHGVLSLLQQIDRPVELPDGRRFHRRMLPCISENGEVEGLVITFREYGAAAPAEQPAWAASAKPSARSTAELIHMLGRTASALSDAMNNLQNIATQLNVPGDAPTPRDDLREEALKRIDTLTQREKQVMKMVVAGNPSKIIATELGISQRTVENHRAAIMRKTGSRSLPALTRLAFASGLSS